MSEETGQELCQYNLNLVKCLNIMKIRRNELVDVIDRQEAEKKKLQSEVERMTYKLALLNKLLCQRLETKQNYDSMIEQFEEKYQLLVKTSQNLLHNVENECEALANKMEKNIQTSDNKTGTPDLDITKEQIDDRFKKTKKNRDNQKSTDSTKLVDSRRAMLKNELRLSISDETKKTVRKTSANNDNLNVQYTNDNELGSYRKSVDETKKAAFKNVSDEFYNNRKVSADGKTSDDAGQKNSIDGSMKPTIRNSAATFGDDFYLTNRSSADKTVKPIIRTSTTPFGDTVPSNRKSSADEAKRKSTIKDNLRSYLEETDSSETGKTIRSSSEDDRHQNNISKVQSIDVGFHLGKKPEVTSPTEPEVKSQKKDEINSVNTEDLLSQNSAVEQILDNLENVKLKCIY